MAQKPSFVLHGRIVTMQSEDAVIDDGYIAISNGLIAAITDDKDKLPAEFSGKKIIDTNGTIYPGLIDLHNHFVYNVLPLWVVPRKYDNRSQWPSHTEYKAGVSKPIKQALAKFSVSSKALVRYVEGKALMGGTTTGQGMRTQVKGGSKIFQGALRFSEVPGSDNLLPAGSLVPDLVVTGSTAKERIDSFRNALENENRGAYFYHLSEGIDDRARQHFFNLKDNDLIQEKLVGIHSLGLHKEDLEELQAKGAKVVWSPFSNQLLYGETMDLQSLKDSGVLFSLGCDWSPSGSKNILQELKVAWHTNKEQGEIFSAFELVKAVTINAATINGWQEFLGTLEKGKMADLIVIDGADADPFMQLIRAIEKDVALVVIDGVPRYGSSPFMKSLRFDMNNKLEDFTVAGSKKSFYLYAEDSAINDIGFGQSIDTLTDIMNDLPGFVKRMEEEESAMMELGVEPVQDFTVELDNEFEIEADVFQEYERPSDAELMADPPMADSVEFDGPVVEGDSYWKRIDEQKNISKKLKAWLKECYGQA